MGFFKEIDGYILVARIVRAAEELWIGVHRDGGGGAGGVDWWGGAKNKRDRRGVAWRTP